MSPMHSPSQTRIVMGLFVCLLSILFTLPATASPEQWARDGWKTDFSRKTIDFADILSGGPPKDGIPSIDNPVFKPHSAITDIAAPEPVVSIAIGSDARAYPLRVLIWHEIVNDTVGGIPVAVTFCPLCNAAIVFDRRIDGRALEFGTTGKLRHSDLVMYDRATESWWQQFTGQAIIGAMVGKSLKMLPARLESYAEFTAREAGGKVLVPNDPSLRKYGQNPYVGYDRSATPFLYRGDMPAGINPMARVVAVRHKGVVLAVALTALREKKTLTRSGVTLSWQPGQTSAVDTREIASGRDVGTVSATIMEGAAAVAVPYDVTFAFTFHAFHPDVPIETQ